MNKNISSGIKELEEFLNRDDLYCSECGKKLEKEEIGPCDEDELLCDNCWMEFMFGPF